MGHAHHFLSRLDRVDREETELALAFYRDPELLRAVITRARVPERAERVAVRLTSENDGPCVIVTRDARFVTCLGRGMFPGDVPVISRAQLDAIAANEQSLRARLRAASELLGDTDELRAIGVELLRAGDGLPRETMARLRATEPVLGPVLLPLLSEELFKTESLVRDASKVKYPRGAELDLLRSVWERAWRIQHLAVAVAGDAARGALQKADAVAPFCRTFLGCTAAFNTLPMAARAVWAVARLGKVALPTLKQMYAEPRAHRQMVRVVALSLMGVGIRHASVRAEILKTLAPRHGAPPDSHDAATHRLAADLFANVDRQRALWVMMAREKFVPHLDRLAADGLIASPCVDAVPEEVALASNFVGECSLFEREGVLPIVSLLSTLCRADGDALYLPEAWAGRFATTWATARSETLIERYRGMYAPAAPVTAPARPGRNEACACGSGKKYKRCCA